MDVEIVSQPSEVEVALREARRDAAPVGASEWWETRPDGAEHFFLVPPSWGEGPLVIELALTGASATLVAPDAAVLVAGDGRRFDYAGLRAWDERGCELPAWMELTADGLRVLVDDAGAVGLVTVDPLLSPVATLERDVAGAELGTSVASAGDVDGDGFEDVIVGAPHYSNGQADEGAVFLYRGTAGGLSATPSWSFESDAAGARLGGSVASAGDVNGDGYDDLVAGAERYTNGQNGEGRAFVWLGSPTGPAALPAWTVESDQASAHLGTAVASAGDVNGDGYDDVAVGAPDWNGAVQDEGEVSVWFGSAAGLAAAPGWTMVPTIRSTGFGEALASAGDVDGDGDDELIVGLPRHLAQLPDYVKGAAWMFLGSPTGPSAAADWQVSEANTENSSFGGAFASGDLDLDGYDDVLVGTIDNDDLSGAVYLYRGGPAGLAVDPAWTGSPPVGGWEADFGMGIAAGDVDGDGFPDVVVGDPGRGAALGALGDGRFWVFRGSAAGPSEAPDWGAPMGQPGAGLGWSVAAADVDGDGADDLVIAAPLHDGGQIDEGALFVYPGCPFLPDGDGDGVGDACDTCPGEDDRVDEDGDPHADACELCVGDDTTGDTDGDGVCDDRDLCFGDDATGDSDAVFLDLLCDDLDVCWGDDAAGDADGDGICGAIRWDDPGLILRTFVVGDFDGDGLDDVLGGAPLFDHELTDEGRAYVWRGTPDGLDVAPSWMAEGNAASLLYGETVTAGDFDGDGHDDVAVGAPRYGRSDGRVDIFYGTDAGPAGVGVAILGQLSEQLGLALAAGDFDGDGQDGLYTGSDVNGYNSGPWLRAHLGDGGERFWYEDGFALVDLTGDGRDDLVEIRDSASTVAIVHGRDGELPNGPDDRVLATTAPAAVAVVGDVDGDGVGDLVVGEPDYASGEVDEGRIRLFLGRSTGVLPLPRTTIEANVANARLGALVAAAGDVDGDGHADVLVYQESPREVLLYLGTRAGLSATPAARLASPSVRGLASGDVDGDGHPDLLVGDSSRLWVYSCFGPDADADGAYDGCDACPLDAMPDDDDGDGVCDSDDLCPGADDADDADGDGVPTACDLRLQQAGTVSPGQPIALRAVRARPSETVHFWASDGGVGVGPCPAAMGGRCLELGPPATYLGSVVADAAGTAQHLTVVPAGLAPGSTLTFQAAIVRGPGGADSDATQPLPRLVQP